MMRSVAYSAFSVTCHADPNRISLFQNELNIWQDKKTKQKRKKERINHLKLAQKLMHNKNLKKEMMDSDVEELISGCTRRSVCVFCSYKEDSAPSLFLFSKKVKIKKK